MRPSATLVDVGMPQLVAAIHLDKGQSVRKLAEII
jgi:hypothetical protein